MIYFIICLIEGPNAHCGHYYDLIKDPSNGQWFTYNDKEVASSKQPGVDVENGTIRKATPDMRGCYTLIYQRSDANGEVTKDNLRMPPPEIVNPLREKLEEEFLKETREDNRSMNLCVATTDVSAGSGGVNEPRQIEKGFRDTALSST